jgi:hypothetical protein
LVVLACLPAARLSASLEAATPPDSSGVRATVRSNPLRVRIYVLTATVRACGVAVVVIDSQNLSTERLTVTQQSLAFDDAGFRTIGHLDLGLRSIGPERHRMSIWLLRPLSAGEYVVMASIRAVLLGESVTSTSAGEFISVRGRCSSKR